MEDFTYQDNYLFCEEINVSQIVEEQKTPVYIYSSAAIRRCYKSLQNCFRKVSPRICYAVKANPNLAILHLLYELGAQFEVGSGGELHRVLAVGISPENICLGGIGKTAEDIHQAILHRVSLINVESFQELELVERLATQHQFVVPVALRINPDVSAGTHEYITTGTLCNKFGMEEREIYEILSSSCFPNVKISGLHIHLGSQITHTKSYSKAIARVLPIIETLRAKEDLPFFNLGGGFPVNYGEGTCPSFSQIADNLIPLLQQTRCRIILEPGRSITGSAGILVTKVLYTKSNRARRFIIADAGMNALLRPVLYGAHHDIQPVKKSHNEKYCYDVMGPLCESGDYLALQRNLPMVKQGDLLAVFTTGAYGAAMSSNYNSHPRPSEILVDKDHYTVIRQRESYEDLIRLENFPHL